MIPSFFVIRNKLSILGSRITSCVCVKTVPSSASHEQHLNRKIYTNTSNSYLCYPLINYNYCREFKSGLLLTKNTKRALQTSTDLASDLNPPKSNINVGSFYLENLFSFNSKEWFQLFTNAVDRETILYLLTNFQRYIRHLECRQLLHIVEKCSKFEIRDNNESIDVHYVLLCEILYNFLYKNNRTLSIIEISRLCKIMIKLKFNREFNCKASVPICSRNFEFNNDVVHCENCKLRYKELLDLSGGDLVSCLMVSLGKSILLQSKEFKNLHENMVIPYLVMVGNKNCTLCSHIVRQLCAHYAHSFYSTNSIRNMAIVLHTIKRTKSRANPLARRIVDRLSQNGVVEKLLDKELSTNAKLVSISQILQFCINSHYTRSEFSRKLDMVVYRTIKYATEVFKGAGADELKQYPNFISQLNLLNKTAELERSYLNRLLEEGGLKCFLSELSSVVPSFSPSDYNTSNTHVQVDSVLKSFNYETLLEHFISPYLVDIFIPSKNAVIEVDGPYHYATNINSRVNKILMRPVSQFPLQYTLNSKLKRRLLSKSGYNYINIPYHEWPQSINEQIYYISNLKI